MRSSPDARTTPARIRDAAVDLFGQQGIDATSVRAIAERAGVSAALVIHHFGSKDALRRACDEHIVGEMMGRNSAMLDDPDLSATMQHWIADLDTYRPSLSYLARMISDGTDEGAALFDGLVERTEELLSEGIARGTMNPASDLRTTAVVVAAHGLIPLLLERHMGRALGQPGLTLELVRRLTIPTLELYTHGLYADSSALDAARTALAGAPSTARSPHSDKGDREPHQDPDPPQSTQ
jgi:TetR/AcrR family transcriptional regulator, regulator of cefoperazone and chloramphenicol sensitivity